MSNYDASISNTKVKWKKLKEPVEVVEERGTVSVIHTQTHVLIQDSRSKEVKVKKPLPDWLWRDPSC